MKKLFVLYILLSLTLHSCVKDERLSPQKPKTISSQYLTSLNTVIDDSLKLYTRDFYLALNYADNITGDAFNHYENQAIITHQDSGILYSEFMENNISNFFELEISLSKLNNYISRTYNSSTIQELTEVLTNSMLANEDDSLLIWADPCADYKKCISNAKEHIMIGAAKDLTLVALVSGGNPWVLLGGFIVVTGASIISYGSDKTACCTSDAAQHSCCK